MDTDLIRENSGHPGHSKTYVWVTCLALSLIIPVLILSIQKFLSAYVPVELHGSVTQRYLLGIFLVAGIPEWITLLGLWLLMRSHGEGFRDLV